MEIYKLAFAKFRNFCSTTTIYQWTHHAKLFRLSAVKRRCTTVSSLLHFNARLNRWASWPSFYDATSLQNQASFMYHCPLCGPFPQELIVRRAHISQPVGTRQVNSCRIRLRWESFSNCMWKKGLYRSIRGTRREIANVKWNVGADWSHFSICAVKCTAVIWLSGSCSRAHWQTETLRSVFMAAVH